MNRFAKVCKDIDFVKIVAEKRVRHKVAGQPIIEAPPNKALRQNIAVIAIIDIALILGRPNFMYR